MQFRSDGSIRILRASILRSCLKPAQSACSTLQGLEALRSLSCGPLVHVQAERSAGAVVQGLQRVH
eukprot:8537039-Alexandrium_andersonii.AAC.1